MKKIILSLALVLMFISSIAIAEEDVLKTMIQGCNKWDNIGTLKPKEEKTGTFLVGYCKGIEEGLSRKYGSVKTTYSNLIYGIGQNVEYSYSTFCFTWEQLLPRLTDDELKKFMLTIASPLITKEKKIYPVVYLLSFLSQKDFSAPAFFDIDINFYSDKVQRTERYNALFQTLFTGKGESAYEVIKTMPEDFIKITDDFCE